MSKIAVAAIFLAIPADLFAAASAKSLVPDSSFPSAHDFYQPLIADPMELGYGGRLIYPPGEPRLGEIMIGDYVGIVRWRLTDRWDAQLNLGGGAIARFDLLTQRNALQVVDFTGTLPVDIAFDGRHALRLAYWHTSSHLGDDYIGKVHPVLNKRAIDEFKSVYSWSVNPFWRLYGGGAFAFNSVNIGKRLSAQGGIELMSRPITEYGEGRLFVAQDLQAFQRVGWNPSYNIRTGVRFSEVRRIAAASIFVEYFTGHQYYLQFFDVRETHWGFGLKFEIGNPTRQ